MLPISPLFWKIRNTPPSLSLLLMYGMSCARSLARSLAFSRFSFAWGAITLQFGSLDRSRPSAPAPPSPPSRNVFVFAEKGRKEGRRENGSSNHEGAPNAFPLYLYPSFPPSSFASFSALHPSDPRFISSFLVPSFTQRTFTPLPSSVPSLSFGFSVTSFVKFKYFR